MKLKYYVVAGVVLLIVLIGSMLHSNDIQEFQVVQSPTGAIDIIKDGGIYFKFMPKIWTYPKVETVYFSNEKDESKDNDGVKVRFSNKGEGDISSQVVYRLYNTNEEILKMHEYVAGSQERVEELLLAKLKDIIMEKASNITSSQAVENREALAEQIRKDYVNNKELMNNGIKVEQFSITQISFDKTTTALFEAQQKADLQKKTAEAEKQNLIMQKERTEAEYAQKIAASKGAAEVEMMKQVTDAERQKKLAEIEAQKKVAIEQLAKEEALVKASKLLELAEIEKKTEAEKLEVIRLQANQKIDLAKAKQQEIQLSGAITETELTRLEIDRDTKIGVAKAIAEGLSKMILPKTFIMGGGNVPAGQNPMETFFQLMNVKQAEELAK
ncbi:MAG: hypothetical protein IKW38_03530 [Kiritimatiellae bacterium]|nr:hypothetical protein [Kiritimatiellia bacterium]